MCKCCHNWFDTVLHQEEHPAHKKLNGKVLAWLCLERGANDLHMVQLMSLLPHHLLCHENPEWFYILPPWCRLNGQSPSCYSMSLQDTQACSQPTRMSSSSHEHHWSLGSGRSVLLVLQLGTAFWQTLGPQPAPLSSKRNLKHTRCDIISFVFLTILSGQLLL